MLSSPVVIIVIRVPCSTTCCPGVSQNSAPTLRGGRGRRFRERVPPLPRATDYTRAKTAIVVRYMETKSPLKNVGPTDVVIIVGIARPARTRYNYHYYPQPRTCLRLLIRPSHTHKGAYTGRCYVVKIALNSNAYTWLPKFARTFVWYSCAYITRFVN